MKSLFSFAILLLSLNANSFDMPKLPSTPAVPKLPEAPKAPAGNPEVEKKVNDFLKKNSDANDFMQKSNDSLFKIIAPKQHLSTSDNYMKKVEAMSDAKEKAAGLKKVREFQRKVIAQVLADDKSMKAVGNLNDADKVSLGKIIYNLHLATLLDKDLANQAPDVVKAATSDPMVVKRADEIKAATEETKVQMESGQKVLTGVTKLAGLNGVKVDMPKSAQDAPK